MRVLFSFLMVLMINICFSQSKEEKTAITYCEGCINDLTILERQKENLKLQIATRGVMLLNRDGKIESLQMLLLRANELLKLEMNKKPKFKDLGFWQKLGAYLKAAGVTLFVAVGVLTGVSI